MVGTRFLTFVCALAAIFAPPAGAQVLAEALLTLPAGTKALEYDNLGQLRTLPNFALLREQYSGAELRDVKSAFSQMGIAEEDIQEVVTASEGGTGIYGVAGGAFSRTAATKTALRAGLVPAKLEREEAFCPNIEVCVVLLSDSLAAFGSKSRVTAMLETRRGVLPRLGSNEAAGRLIGKTDRGAPVIGFGAGRELSRWLAESMPDSALSRETAAELLSAVAFFGYSVKPGERAQVNLALECRSEIAALALSAALRALGTARALPVELTTARSLERMVEVKFAAPILLNNKF